MHIAYASVFVLCMLVCCDGDGDGGHDDGGGYCFCIMSLAPWPELNLAGKPLMPHGYGKVK